MVPGTVNPGSTEKYQVTTLSMQCPHCGCTRIFRDRYQGANEWLRLTPFRPYGCRECLHRFINWRYKGVAGDTIGRRLLRLFLIFSAACPGCRARELERVNRRSIHGSIT